MKRVLLLTIALVMMSITTLAAVYTGSCGDNVTYTLDTESGLLKIEGEGAMEDDYYDSMAPWYSKRNYIKTVEIAVGVTSIGKEAFSDCTGLTSITIPNSVKSIGDWAFAYCTSLKSVTIPNSVTSIEDWAFVDCYFLSEKYINNSSITGTFGATLCDLETDEGLLIKEGIAVKCRPGVSSITIPNSVTSIGDNAIAGCTGLTSITIPKSVKSIGDYAFEYCLGLTSITIPNSVTSIANTAFCDCYFQSDKFINNSIVSGTFGATLCDLETEKGLLIKDNVAKKCRLGVTSVTIPNSVTSIGEYAFFDCEFRTIVCKSQTPPNIGIKNFTTNGYNHVQIYVPENTYWNYAYSDWGEFIRIKEFANDAADVKESQAYMIADTNGKNYTVFRNGQLRNVEYTHQLEEDEVGSCWQIKRSGDHRYLYSPEAKSYATMQDGKLALTTAPVDIELSEQDGDLTINGTKCLLVLNNEVELKADDDAITDIKQEEAGSPIYNLQGHRLQKTQKGLNIVNGRKILLN